jgi:hypothetical protein
MAAGQVIGRSSYRDALLEHSIARFHNKENDAKEKAPETNAPEASLNV